MILSLQNFYILTNRFFMLMQNLLLIILIATQSFIPYYIIFHVFVLKKALTVPVFYSTCFTFLNYIIFFPSVTLLTRFDNKLALNLELSIKFILKNLVITFYLPYLSILLVSFSIGTQKSCPFLQIFS